MKPKPIRFYWWPLWMFLLALALVIFYGILTPIWMGIRFLAWMSDHRGRKRRAGAEVGSVP
jgi:hypothetical protein